MFQICLDIPEKIQNMFKICLHIPENDFQELQVVLHVNIKHHLSLIRAALEPMMHLTMMIKARTNDASNNDDKG